MGTTKQGSRFLSEEFQAAEAVGIEQGREQGIEQGLAEGARRSLLRVLGSRQVTVSAEERALIEAEGDLGVLDGWIDRALTAATCAEVLNE